jgi:uncharacterized protein DUF4124
MYKTLLFFIFFVFQTNIAYSDVYKWKDENGKIVYGDKPTTNNADKIEIKSPPKKDEYYQERYKKQQKLLNVMQDERDEEIALKNKETEEKQKKKEKCAKLIKELQKTKDAALLYEKTDDPYNPRIFTDEERKAEEEKYEKYIKENCL